jgi:hypothetical protein
MMMMMVGKTAPFDPHPSLEGSAGLQPVLTFADFITLFFFLLSKIVRLASNPQHGGQNLCIYVPELQGSPVIRPRTWFPFHRLLQLAGIRWRYSNPPPHGDLT